MSNCFLAKVSYRLFAIAGLGITVAIAFPILDRGAIAQLANAPKSITMSFNANNYQWKNRLMLVFAPSEQDSAYQAQKQLILGHQRPLEERDFRLIEVFANGKSRIDNQELDAASVAQLRDRFGISKDEFCLILVGKDGFEKRRDRSPVKLTKIFAQVDRMPMRQQEMRERGNL